MDDWNGRLEAIRKREADPAWQAAQQQAKDEREREVVKAISAGQREALRALELPATALEAIGQGPPARRTMALNEVEKPATILVLYGGTGVGKTVAASWWLFSFVADRRNWTAEGHGSVKAKLRGSAMFVTAPKLARWGRYDDREMDTLLRASRLVIDDLGTEYLDAKGNFMALFDELINERYAHRRPTVITTNLPLEVFRERYGERVADRIRGDGRYVGLGDESMRPRGGRGPQGGGGGAPLALVGGRGKAPAPPAADPRLPPEPDDDAPPRTFVP